MPKANIITLIGLPGVGKSRIGKELSERMGIDFLDLDDYIESRQRRKIKEIFETEGEAAFRAIEFSTLREVIGEHRQMLNQVQDDSCSPTLILALGGGTVMTPACAELVRTYTHCIYLQASFDTIVDHLQRSYTKRPMMVAAVKQMLNQVQHDSGDETSHPELGSGSARHTADIIRSAIRGKLLELHNARHATYSSVAHSTLCVDSQDIISIYGAILSCL